MTIRSVASTPKTKRGPTKKKKGFALTRYDDACRLRAPASLKALMATKQAQCKRIGGVFNWNYNKTYCMKGIDGSLYSWGLNLTCKPKPPKVSPKPVRKGYCWLKKPAWIEAYRVVQEKKCRTRGRRPFAQILKTSCGMRGLYSWDIKVYCDAKPSKTSR